MGAGQGLALESKALISTTSGLLLGLGNGMDLLHSSSRVGQKHWQIRAKSRCTAEAFQCLSNYGCDSQQAVSAGLLRSS